jgi:putative tricarboxylic transport membrane protein
MDRRTTNLREIGLGVGLIVLAAGVVQQAMTVPIGFGYDNVGPRTFPYIIAAGLFLSGASIIMTERARGSGREKAQPHDWPSIVAISATLLAQMFVIVQVGWIPVATVSFAIIAWAFGSRQFLLSLGLGLAVAVGTFLLFNQGLGLNLPIGTWVEPLLPTGAAPAAAPAG